MGLRIRLYFVDDKSSCINFINLPLMQDWSNESPLMMHRQHHPDGNKEMQAQMALFFHLPNK